MGEGRGREEVARQVVGVDRPPRTVWVQEQREFGQAAEPWRQTLPESWFCARLWGYSCDQDR